MSMLRMVAALGLGLAATVVSPQAALAAGVPGAAQGVRQTRSYFAAQETWLYWKPVANASEYRITVDGGGTQTTHTVPSSQPLNAGGTHMQTVATPDKCSSYRISVTAVNATGTGRPVTVVERPLVPTGVTRASGVRGADKTTARFTYSPPNWTGYQGGPTGGATAESKISPRINVTVETQLVRISDGAVIATNRYERRGWALATNQDYTGLDAKRTYALKIATGNGWGSCTSMSGKIVLKAA